MCTVCPNLKNAVKRSYDSAIVHDIEQTAYSKMIQ